MKPPYTLAEDSDKLPTLPELLLDFTIDLISALVMVAAICGTVGYMWGIWK